MSFLILKSSNLCSKNNRIYGKTSFKTPLSVLRLWFSCCLSVIAASIAPWSVVFGPCFVRHFLVSFCSFAVISLRGKGLFSVLQLCSDCLC